MYAWYLWYCELLCALVCCNNSVGVKYVSLSIDRVPIWILWKKANEDFSRRAFKGGQSKLSNISRDSPTLLIFGHLLQPHLAAVLCTFSNWVIWVLTWGCKIGGAYSNLGHLPPNYCLFTVKSDPATQGIFCLFSGAEIRQIRPHSQCQISSIFPNFIIIFQKKKMRKRNATKKIQKKHTQIQIYISRLGPKTMCAHIKKRKIMLVNLTLLWQTNQIIGLKRLCLWNCKQSSCYTQHLLTANITQKR